MQDITRTKQEVVEIDKKEMVKDGIIAIIPTVLILFLVQYFIISGLLPTLIIVFGIPIIIKNIRVSKNIKLDRKMVLKIFLLELAGFVTIFVIIAGIMYLFFN